MSIYHFDVTLAGSGDTMEDAWTDACEAFTQEPGEPEIEKTRCAEED